MVSCDNDESLVLGVAKRISLTKPNTTYLQRHSASVVEPVALEEFGVQAVQEAEPVVEMGP